MVCGVVVVYKSRVSSFDGKVSTSSMVRKLFIQSRVS
jgi:hypothetical protein